MKPILALAICFAVMFPAFCQAPAPKGQQEKEQQLRIALQQMRDAIDHYHGMFIRGKMMAVAGREGYPADLEALVKRTVDTHGQTIHFLPKIPVDLMTGTTDWGVRHLGNLPQGPIFDLYTKSEGTALDGSKYKDW